MIKEQTRTVSSGWLMGILVPILILAILIFIRGVTQNAAGTIVLASFMMALGIVGKGTRCCNGKRSSCG